MVKVVLVVRGRLGQVGEAFEGPEGVALLVEELECVEVHPGMVRAGRRSRSWRPADPFDEVVDSVDCHR
jgi:hypothetical protein